MVHQLTRNLNEEQIKTAGFDTYFVDHTTGVYPQFASGYPWSASTMQVTGDIIADLTEDLAAEQKARLTYDNILRLSDDPDVNDVIRFLREREVVHFQRFGEANHNKLSRRIFPSYVCIPSLPSRATAAIKRFQNKTAFCSRVSFHL